MAVSRRPATEINKIPFVFVRSKSDESVGSYAGAQAALLPPLNFIFESLGQLQDSTYYNTRNNKEFLQKLHSLSESYRTRRNSRARQQ